LNTNSEVLGNAGAPITVEHPEWGTLCVARFDQEAKTKIEQHLKSSALNFLNDQRSMMSDAEYQLAFGAISDRVVSADYKFGGRVCNDFMKNGSGSSYIARMLVKRADGKEIPEMDFYKSLATEPSKSIVTSAVKLALAESFPKVQTPAPAPGTSESETFLRL
jgi:hypothetical protein